MSLHDLVRSMSSHVGDDRSSWESHTNRTDDVWDHDVTREWDDVTAVMTEWNDVTTVMSEYPVSDSYNTTTDTNSSSSSGPTGPLLFLSVLKVSSSGPTGPLLFVSVLKVSHYKIMKTVKY